MDKDIPGLTLDQPRLLLKEDGVPGRAVFYGALMVLGGLGGWGCFITAFQIPVYTNWLVVSGLLCVAFSVWRQTDSRRRWWPASLPGWAAWMLLLIFRFDGAAHGAVRTVNFMLDCYGAKLNYDLPSLWLPYSAGTARTDITGECTSFIMILFFPFFWAMARMWVKSRNNRAPFGLTGALLLLPMSFSILPAGWAFGALLMFWCMLLLMAHSLGGNEGVIGRFRKRGYKASGVAVARPVALLMLLAVGLCMWAVYMYAPLDTYERPELAESLRTVIREGVGSSQYLRSGQGNSNKEVQLRTMGRRDYTGETMLRVKFDWNMQPEYSTAFRRVDRDGEEWWESPRDDGSPATNFHKEYLKSFVGTVYTGESWQRLDYEGRGELPELALRAQNQIADYKRTLFAPGRDKQSWYELSVQNVGANPRCVYIPAGLISTEDELSQYGIELVDDGYAKSGSFIDGTREYTLSGESVGYGFNYFSRVVSHTGFKDYGVQNLEDLGSALLGDVIRDKYDPNSPPGGLMTWFPSSDSGTWVTMAGGDWVVAQGTTELFESINSQGDAAGPGWPADLWEMPELELWEGLDKRQQEYLKSVEQYNKFVYDHYPDVPQELRGFLEDFQEAYDLDPLGHNRAGNFRYADGVEFYAAKIAKAFREYYTYTLDPAQPPAGRDFVEFFLGESHQGYCVHFATAAVMLLRAAGYPARYAEGYVVPSQGGWVDVPDYNAHAWAEVYCGGTGWMPVEVTPAAMDNPAAFYDATIPDNPGEYIPTPRPEIERPTLPPRDNPLIDEQTASPTPRAGVSAAPSPGAQGPGGSTGKKGSAPWAVIWCLSWAAAVVGAVVLQRLLRVKKLERDLGQRDKSAAGLKAYGYLLKLYGKEVFCGVRGDPPKRWKELAEKARFSNHMLSDEELSELIGDADRLREKLKRELPRGQKLLCWLSGLL